MGEGVRAMQVPTWVKPGIWGAVIGAVAMSIAGFWGLGWTTSSTAQHAAQASADAAVVKALVPFCVTKAQLDPDATKLAKVRAETSPYTRTELVKNSGWAPLIGTATVVDSALAEACADQLLSLKAG